MRAYQFLAEEKKVTVYTDPSYQGATLDDKYWSSKPSQKIDFNKLEPFEPESKMHVKKSADNMKRFVDKIRAGEKIKPIIVTPKDGKYLILDGHHRYFAARIAKVDSMEAVVVPEKFVTFTDEVPDESEQHKQEYYNEEAANVGKIFVDMDGVISDLYNHIGKELGVKDYNDITPEQWNDFYENADAYELFKNAPAFPTASKLIQTVKEFAGGYSILSKPLNFDRKNSIKGKKEWLANNLDVTPDRVIFADDKSKYAVSDGMPNILIDDEGKHINAWNNAGGFGIKYKADEDSLSDVIKALKSTSNDKHNEEAAGVGIVTKQNATADVPVGGEYMNVKKLFPKKKKKKESIAYEDMFQGLNPKSEIYVDMDGVLADFFGEWKKLVGKDWREIDKDELEPALKKIRDEEDFWLNIPLTSNAKKLLGIIKQVKGNYKILSSPLANDPKSEPHKREWIEKNLDFFPPTEVIITKDKAKYATNPDGTPNILIDDYGVNIAAWESAGGIGFKHKDHKFERTAKKLKAEIEESFQSLIRNYIEEKWSAKYKKSINCSNPKGFSQKAHCAGRKKK